jgi:hypothetical protein
MEEELRQAIEALGNVSGLFNPFSIYQMRGIDGSFPFSSMLNRLTRIGASLLVILTLAELIRHLIHSTGKPQNGNGFLGIILKSVLAAAFLMGYQWLVIQAVSIFPAIGSALLGQNAQDIHVQIDSALATIQLEGASNFKLWTGNIFDLAASAIFASVLSFLALILMWVLSLLQAYMFLFWFMIGPLAVPTWAFSPLSHIFKNWMGSILGVGFWSVTCSIMVCICARAHFLDKGFAGGSSGDIVAACVFSIAAIFMMVSSVWVSNHVFSGIELGLRKSLSNTKRASAALPSPQGNSSNNESRAR